MKKPEWFGLLNQVSADPTGRWIGMTGLHEGALDTVAVAVVPADGGIPVIWAKQFAEGGYVGWLAGGGIVFEGYLTEDFVTLYRVTSPGKLQRLGTVPRPVSSVTFSADLEHVAVNARDYHGDAWMSRVERR